MSRTVIVRTAVRFYPKDILESAARNCGTETLLYGDIIPALILVLFTVGPGSVLAGPRGRGASDEA